MPRKAAVSADQIEEAAFEMTREEGISSVTARKLAARMGCSTQPIFRLYANMEELLSFVYGRTVNFFENFYQSFPKQYSDPFTDIGLAYIAFAQKERHLFSMLFLSDKPDKKSLFELLNGSGALTRELKRVGNMGIASPENLFTNMWILIHGVACMSITGDYDLDDSRTVELLKSAAKAFKDM